MSFAAWQVAALDKQYKREQAQFLRTPQGNSMERTRVQSSEKSVPGGTPSKVMIKEANTQLMLMFEKISTLESELEVKTMELDEASTHFAGTNDTLKLLEKRVQELEGQSIEKDKAHNAQLVSYQQQCQNQLNVMKEQCKLQMKELNDYIANYQKEAQAEVVQHKATLGNFKKEVHAEVVQHKSAVATLEKFKKEAQVEIAEYRKSAIILQDEKDMYEESAAKLDVLVSSLLNESNGLQESILNLEEQIMDYQQEILDLNDENIKLKEHHNSKDRKFSVLLSTEASLLTLVNLISTIKSTRTVRKSEKEDLVPQTEPTREEAKPVEPEAETPQQEMEPEAAADEAPAEPESTAPEPREEMQESETAQEQIDEEVAEVKEADDGETSDFMAEPIEQSEETVETETLQRNEISGIETSSSVDLLADRTENISETAAETSDGATGAKTEPTKPEHELMEAQEESAQIPSTDSTPQFEIVEHETIDPQPEILIASSMSGSSFVNVPSYGEVDSYQDISTSSPDLCPSSPNLSHSSTPTGDRDDVSDEEQEARQEQEIEQEVDQNEEAVVKRAIEEEREVAGEGIGEEVAEPDDVQSEQNPSEDVDAQTEDCENVEENNDCCAPPRVTADEPAECCNDKPEEISDSEPTREELSTSEVEQPQTTGETSVEQPQTTAATQAEEVKQLQNSGATPAEEVEEPQSTETSEGEQPQATEATRVEEPQTTETEVERPSAEVGQPPTQPPRPGFIFTVNPSVVPGSIIRTPERPSNKPQSSLYENTPLGTAEI